MHRAETRGTRLPQRRGRGFWLVAVMAWFAVAGAVTSGTAHAEQRRPRRSKTPATESKPAPVQSALNSLRVIGNPAGADVLVDGESVGQTPIELPVPVTNGEHTIRVTKPGFAPYNDVFKAVPGRPVRLEVELIPIAGVLRVSSSLKDVRVQVDGKYIGDAPVAVELEPGPHQVVAVKQCYTQLAQKIEAVAGNELALEAALTELPAAQNPCIPKPPPPPKWYQKKWVWGVIAGSAVAVGGGAVGLYFGLNRDPLSGVDAVIDARNNGGTGLRF